MQTTLRSECASRKSPRAAEPNKITHSRFAAANSFSLRTNSASFVSVDCISNPFLSNEATSFPKLPRLRCCRRQIPQTRRLLRHRRSRLRPSLPHPSPGRSCLPAFPSDTRDSPCRPLRRLAIIVLAQVGHHGAPGISRPRIIDHRFEPVAHFDAVFALVGSDEQQHAAIVFFTSDSKLLEQIHRVVLDTLAFERLDGDNRQLRAGLLLHLRA